jgi:hypothetical protein
MGRGLAVSAAQEAFAFTYAPRHIVCFSGGHSSALVAVEVVRRYGRAGVVLLNHDINPRVEDADIKRFKREVADALGLPITYASHAQWETVTQFDVCRKARAFKVKNGEELCTNRLKTKPFKAWLASNTSPVDAVIYYGFDADEQTRIQRRSTIMAEDGWRTDYPLALWRRTIQSTREIGVEPPLTYAQWKHANCVGCLKAGWQHWYVVFCTRPDVWAMAVEAEEDIGYTIHRDMSLAEREPEFVAMKAAGIVPSEHTPKGQFWAEARAAVRNLSQLADDERAMPCACVFRRRGRTINNTPCTCFAPRGAGHALHCARVFGEDTREAA